MKDFNPFGKTYLFHVISCECHMPPPPPERPPAEEKASFGCESRQSCREIHATGSNPIPSMGYHGTGIFTINYLHWVDSLW